MNEHEPPTSSGDRQVGVPQIDAAVDHAHVTPAPVADLHGRRPS